MRNFCLLSLLLVLALLSGCAEMMIPRMDLPSVGTWASPLPLAQPNLGSIGSTLPSSEIRPGLKFYVRTEQVNVWTTYTLVGDSTEGADPGWVSVFRVKIVDQLGAVSYGYHGQPVLLFTHGACEQAREDLHWGRVPGYKAESTPCVQVQYTVGSEDLRGKVRDFTKEEGK
jgi:hypothetical protein